MAVVILCSLPLLGAFALVPPTSYQRRCTSSLHSSFFDGGWDNDNFLDSLNRGNSESDTGAGNAASERANDEYWEQSKYGRSPPWAESNNPPKPPPTPTKLSYAEALRQRQLQKMQQQQQQKKEDLTAVSDAADEIYAYSYNKHAKAPPTNQKLSYAESLKQQQQLRMQQQQQPDLTSVSDAAAEIYAYSYNKKVDAPVDESTIIDVDPSEKVEIDTTKKEPIPKHLVEKAKASHEDDKEEASQGGSRFRELIEKAKEKASQQPPPPPQPAMGAMDLQLQLMQEQVALLQENILRLQQQYQVPNQSVPQQQMQQQEILQQQQKLQKQQDDLTAVSDAAAEVYSYSYHKKVEVDSAIPPSMIMTPEEIATLSVEEQARLYREYFYVQQHKKRTPSQQKSMGSTSENYLQAGIGFDGKKIGSNRDADVISNTSDAYFAQLKRDSTTRNLARYSGDNVKANDVFHDPAIQDIKVPVNPYLEDQQRRMRDVLDTVPEEMLLFQEFDDDAGKMSKEELASYTGVSYKEKMEQKRRERREREARRRNGMWANFRSKNKP